MTEVAGKQTKRDYLKARYWERKLNEECVRCGRALGDNDDSVTGNCCKPMYAIYAQRSRRTPRWRAAFNKANRDRARAQVAAGLCRIPYCTSPHLNGKTYCERHFARHSKYAREWAQDSKLGLRRSRGKKRPPALALIKRMKRRRRRRAPFRVQILRLLHRGGWVTAQDLGDRMGLPPQIPGHPERNSMQQHLGRMVRDGVLRRQTVDGTYEYALAFPERRDA